MKCDKETMPKHIAIIMDGNRRWAKAQGKPASFGHKEGAKTLEKIVRYANKIGLEYIHKNKTGAFLRLCVRMGAILAKADEKNLERLTRYSEKIGLAFQIKDDILSEEGNEEILGKPVGNDKELEKCTYVSKYGLQGAKEILNRITKEAIDELDEYGEKAEFLRELALYIKNRNK